MVIAGGAAQIDEQAPFELTLNIPADTSGPITLSAHAFDANDDFAAAANIVVNVDVLATLIALSAVPEKLFLFSYAPSERLRVLGSYDDGMKRDVTSSATGTTFQRPNHRYCRR